MFIGVISHHFNTSPSQPGAQLQKTIFAFLTAQNCELNGKRIRDAALSIFFYLFTFAA